MTISLCNQNLLRYLEVFDAASTTGRECEVGGYWFCNLAPFGNIAFSSRRRILGPVIICILSCARTRRGCQLSPCLFSVLLCLGTFKPSTSHSLIVFMYWVFPHPSQCVFTSSGKKKRKKKYDIFKYKLSSFIYLLRKHASIFRVTFFKRIRNQPTDWFFLFLYVDILY
jgi:hypothetical protein